MKQDFYRIATVIAVVSSLVFSLLSAIDVSLVAKSQARLGIQAHAAVCAERAYIQGQVDSSEKFLKMTQEQRLKKYGAIGNVPDNVIRRGLTQQRALLAAFSSANCEVKHG